MDRLAGGVASTTQQGTFVAGGVGQQASTATYVPNLKEREKDAPGMNPRNGGHTQPAPPRHSAFFHFSSLDIVLGKGVSYGIGSIRLWPSWSSNLMWSSLAPAMRG